MGIPVNHHETSTTSSKGDIDGNDAFMESNNCFKSMLMGRNETDWMETWGKEGGGLNKNGVSIWNSGMNKSED